MNSDLVACPCCGKLVSANRMELTFRRPDEIAALTDEDRNIRCWYNNDIYVLDDARFFLRCTIPLPIAGLPERYSIGAWAEVNRESFKRIYDLWEDDQQANEPPMKAHLANNIPLTSGSLNCDVNVQLTGPTTRPEIIIIDKECSLHDEQVTGISLHRANEYSGLIR